MLGPVLEALYHLGRIKIVAAPAPAEPSRSSDPYVPLLAVLLFFSASPWDAAKQERWAQLTGSRDCTSKALCDYVRWVLEQNNVEAET